jgi:hypothetical protein
MMSGKIVKKMLGKLFKRMVSCRGDYQLRHRHWSMNRK